MTSVSDGDSSRLSCSSPETSIDGSSSTFGTSIKDEVTGNGDSAYIPDSQRKPGGGKMKHPKGTSINSALASKGDKQCSVCGDRALGCNFDAISCESCKAFFRRNALKEKQTKCIFDGNCKIDLNTRRFCPHCRLKKCFTVGMNKELILGDDEKKKRLERVQRNRGVGTDESKPMVEMPAVVPLVSSSSSCEELHVFSETPGIVLMPATVANVETVSSVSVPLSAAILHPVPIATTTTTTPQMTLPSQLPFELPPETASLFSLSKLMQFSVDSGLSGLAPLVIEPTSRTAEGHVDLLAPPPVALLANNPDKDMLRSLTSEEDQLLQELVQVYDLSFTADLEPLVHIRQLDPSLNQLVNQSSITILRLIKFAKRLDAFARLPQVCQIGILKGCWIHILLLRSVSLYDCHRDVWVTPRGDIPTEILKNATGFVQLHDDHVSYCKSIKSIIGDDLTIVIILLVVVLFSPEGPHSVARELVSNVQDRYLVLLKHYLESRYNYERAAFMFPELMSKIKELKEFAEIHGKCLVDINPSEIEPIMLEILDLK